jgi:cystathionine beta-lyase/cystathionine gamma-synthase
MSEIHPDTLLAGGGGPAPEPWPDGMSAPIFQSVTYDLHERAYADIERTGGDSTWWYTRLRNPTIEATAAKLAALEHADGAIVFASGMAAIATTLLALVGAGGRVVASRDLYGDVFTLLAAELPRHGRSASFVAVDDIDGWERELAAGADLLYVETLSNPMLRLADLPRLAELAHRAGAIAVADATFTPPTELRALDHGFDVVVHSATKYLNGHSDLVAGAMAGCAAPVATVRAQASILGGCIDPHGAWLLDRGLKTLALRVQRQRENALAIAQALVAHPEVEAVAHPSLPDHPDQELARTLLPGGCPLLSFRVRGGDARAVALLGELEVVRQATSLGGVETLASAPHNTSHLGLSADERRAAGILPGTIRLSVGIEHAPDLLADLTAALDATRA